MKARKGLAALFALAAALPASGSGLRVTLLGTGNPRPSRERSGPATLVEAGDTKLLFDAGRGVTERLMETEKGLDGVDRLFLTHLHSDHVVGVPDLWLTGWLFGRQGALTILGPAGTADFALHLKEAYAFDVHMRRDVDEKLAPVGAELVARDIGEGVAWEEGGVRVTAFAVDHGPVKPALGYRVDFGKRSVVLSGDTRPSENLVRHAKGCDVLIHEVIAPEAEKVGAAKSFSLEQRLKIIAHHTTPEQAGEIFDRVRPRLAVYSHIVPSFAHAEDLVAPTRKHYQGRLEVGEDRMSIEIGETIEVRRPQR